MTWMLYLSAYLGVGLLLQAMTDRTIRTWRKWDLSLFFTVLLLWPVAIVFAVCGLWKREERNKAADQYLATMAEELERRVRDDGSDR